MNEIYFDNNDTFYITNTIHLPINMNNSWNGKRSAILMFTLLIA